MTQQRRQTLALDRAAQACDEFAQQTIAQAMAGEHHQGEGVGVLHLEPTANQQLKRISPCHACFARLTQGQMSPHHTGQAAVVGQGQPGVAQGQGPLHQFFRMRGAVQKGEVRASGQLRIHRQAMAGQRQGAGCRWACHG